MNRRQQMTEVITAMLAVAMITGGCATSTLWEEKSYRPYDNPHLSLALAPERQDVLVQYDERYSESKKLRHRAYWLFASTNAMANHVKPVFVKPAVGAGLMPIPLLAEAQGTNAPPFGGYVAVATPAEQGFDLWRDGVPLGRFYLPIYFTAPRATVWRVMTTPFAALGDMVVVVVVCAAVVAVVVGVIYLESETH